MGCGSIAYGSMACGSVACGYMGYRYIVCGSRVAFSKSPISVLLGNRVVV